MTAFCQRRPHRPAVVCGFRRTRDPLFEDAFHDFADGGHLRIGQRQPHAVCQQVVEAADLFRISLGDNDHWRLRGDGEDLADEVHLAGREQILLVGRNEEIAAGDANLAQERARSGVLRLKGDGMGGLVILNNFRDGGLQPGRTIYDERLSGRSVRTRARVHRGPTAESNPPGRRRKSPVRIGIGVA